MAARISDIQREVSRYFNINPIEMTSHRRARTVARPRQIAMYLARELTPASLPLIGRFFGGRDHTTVMHAIETVERLSDADKTFAGCVAHLRRILQ